MSLKLSAPQPLLPSHQLADFSCGRPPLDVWLKQRALTNHLSGASRTFVSVDATGRVYGYYALAAGGVAHTEATGPVRRNMPDPVPVLVLGRLAVDLQARGLRLGPALLQDAVKRAVSISQDAGVRAMLVHALDERAAAFYQRWGFQPSSIHPLTLMLRLQQPV